MDNSHYSTGEELSNSVQVTRRKGQHLTKFERGIIFLGKLLGMSNRAIAKILRCSPQTVGNELARGTPPRKSDLGRAPGYNADRGQKVYEEHRRNSHRRRKAERCVEFLEWVYEMHSEPFGWSLDQCVGYAMKTGKFSKEEMVCTRTLYDALHRGGLKLKLSDFPDILRRKHKKERIRESKRTLGTSIDERPPVASEKVEYGHWEGDTVVGKKAGDEVLFTLCEKKSRNGICVKIKDKSAESVIEAMNEIKEMFGDRFSQVFKTITMDNGSEFARMPEIEKWGTYVYFTHPYKASERGQNERFNKEMRRYVPKHTAISKYSSDDIAWYILAVNAKPRKVLGYRSPEELFDEFLDEVFSVE